MYEIYKISINISAKILKTLGKTGKNKKIVTIVYNISVKNV